MPTRANRLLRCVRRMASQADPAPDDSGLLTRFLTGRDPAAFEALVARHGPMVLRVCQHVLGNRHDAEDAFQATFLVLARKASSVRPPGALAGWLHGVACHVALRARTAALRRRHAGLAPDLALPDPRPDPLAELTAREALRILEEEVQRLPEAYRLPVVLCCLHGVTQDEAARQLGWTPGSVKGRLERGRKRLQRRLAGRGLGLAAALALVEVSRATAAGSGERLVALTAMAATAVASGNTAGDYLVSAEARSLAEGALTHVALAKVKLGLVLLLAVGTVAAGLAAMGHQLPSEEPPGVKAAMEPSQSDQGAEQQKSRNDREQARTDRHGDPLPAGALARLGTVRFRHGNGATVAFADDKSLLTFGADRTIRTWDAATGRLLREQQLPPGPSANVAVLSPGGRLLAFQDAEAMDAFYLWDVERGRLRHKLPLGERWWHQAAFSPDAKTLVTAQNSGVLKAWDVVTGQGRVLGRLKREDAGLSFAADGTLLSVSGLGHEAIFWDLAGGRERSRLAIPEHIVRAISSPDGRTIASWSWHNPEQDKGVQFWDASAGKPAKGWIAPDLKQVHAVQFAPDGKAVLIGTNDGVLVWDHVAGKRLRTLPGGRGYNLTFSPDGKTVAAFGTGHASHPQGAVLHVWDLATGAPRTANAAEHGHLDEVDGVAFAPDGRTVASSCRGDHSVRLWDAATGRLLRLLPADNLAHQALAFSPDGKQLFAGTSPAIIRWDVATGREVARYPLFEACKEDRCHLLAMRLTADGRKLVAVSQNLEGKERTWGLHAWDVATRERQPTQPLAADDFWIAYSSFSSDGRLLALPGGSVRDAATGKELLRLSVEGKHLGTPVAISRDSALLAAGVWQPINRPPLMGSEMVAVQVWELATLQPVRRIDTGPAAHLTFTRDGRRLIVAGPEALQLWDLASGHAVASQPAPGRFRGSYGASFVSSFALAANSRTVATGHADTTVVLWDLAPPHADRPAAPLSAAELESCWADLAGADAGRAIVALARLAEVPEQATALLRERLRPARAVPAADLRRLLADLDANEFARREAAMNRLAELGELVDAALREALRGQPSPEVRRRIETLLAEPRTVRSPEVRRHLRAARLLEGSGTPEARQVLGALANGAPEARLTREARAALARLLERADPAP